MAIKAGFVADWYDCPVLEHCQRGTVRVSEKAGDGRNLDNLNK